jgi:acid stress-induced BolA-like protein IbaG/YrbA
MALADKIIAALHEPLEASYIRLDSDDGISGIVVSEKFNGVTTLDRQRRIDALLESAKPITPEERRKVVMIAGLTPSEYEAAGARIRVQKIIKRAENDFEIMVHGGRSDADYVRGALNNQKGIKTTEPTQVTDGSGVFMSFHAKGSSANPLSQHAIARILGNDAYVTVLPRG